MAIKTIDVTDLAGKTGNIYESVAILSKRARQLSSRMKAELDDKLSYFEGFDPELEDPRFQEEQARISIEYEKKPQPTEVAIQEMFGGDVYWRHPSDEGES